MGYNLFEKLEISTKMAECIVASDWRTGYLWNWHEGAAQCGKSVTAALTFALIIESAPKEDFLFCVLGYTQSSAINNVFLCGGFGLEAYFGKNCRKGKYNDLNALFIKTNTGEKIVLAFGTNTQTSNNTWHGLPISGFLADEIDRMHPNSINEMKQRLNSKPNARIIATQNPNNPNHPIYKEMDDAIAKGDVKYTHWTLKDNKGLTAVEVEKIMNRYDPTSIFYKRFILGMRVVAEALIYNLDESKNVFEEFDKNNYIEYCICIDTGSTASATFITCCAIGKGFKYVDIVKEYSHRNNDSNTRITFQTTDDDSKQLAIFTKECIKMFNGKRPSCVLFDGSRAVEVSIETALIDYELGNVELRRARKKLKKVKDENSEKSWITDRIKYTSSLLYHGRLRFMKECDKTIDSIKSSQYNPTLLQKGVEERWDEPSENITKVDGEDCVHYSLIYFASDLERYMKEWEE